MVSSSLCCEGIVSVALPVLIKLHIRWMSPLTKYLLHSQQLLSIEIIMIYLAQSMPFIVQHIEIVSLTFFKELFFHAGIQTAVMRSTASSWGNYIC